MAITLINSSTASGTTSPLTINAPANCQAGDVLIAWILARGTNSSISTPNGWNLIGSPVKVGSLMYGLYWHVFVAGETSYSWTVAGGYYSGGIIAWRGVNQTTPIGAYNYGFGTTGTTVTVTAVTTPVPGCMLDFRMGDYASANRTFSNEAFGGSTSGVSEQYDMGNNRCGNAGAYKTQADVGASGDATGAISGSITEWAGGLVALRPATQGITVTDNGSGADNDLAGKGLVAAESGAGADSALRGKNFALIDSASGADTAIRNVFIVITDAGACGQDEVLIGVYVTGSGATSIPVLKSSATGAHGVKGSGAGNLAPVAAAGSGGHGVKGSGEAALAFLTGQGLGGRGVGGIAGSTLSALEAEGTGRHGICGAGAALIPGLESAGFGVAAAEGVAAAAFPSLIGLGVGWHAAGVTGAGTADLPTTAADGYGVVGRGQPGNLRLVVPAENRTLPVPPENRSLTVPFEDRTLRLAA